MEIKIALQLDCQLYRNPHMTWNANVCLGLYILFSFSAFHFVQSSALSVVKIFFFVIWNWTESKQRKKTKFLFWTRYENWRFCILWMGGRKEFCCSFPRERKSETFARKDRSKPFEIVWKQLNSSSLIILDLQGQRVPLAAKYLFHMKTCCGGNIFCSIASVFMERIFQFTRNWTKHNPWLFTQ